MGQSTSRTDGDVDEHSPLIHQILLQCRAAFPDDRVGIPELSEASSLLAEVDPVCVFLLLANRGRASSVDRWDTVVQSFPAVLLR